MATTTDTIFREIKQYVQFVHGGMTVEKVILFGSYANGTATTDSDVDIAIVSPNFGKAPLMEKLDLYGWLHDASVRVLLQPFPFGSEEFKHTDDFFINEIKKTGADITYLLEQ
ncbi:nucleotidyltransferase domain-containing protein [Natribacillus halophilus]|uniref:Nucleotidyltransferase domain-containing protein n=1 Tax=Natribacillus halophilus TaxID=549003 RepID=A0A1G8KCJ0_9BACI|nr:nucleotidyltransferase domain-containing protein [Natribacillus halophilus]SDI41144.1 Nucleotidyltransferase domain-containing protein [Natribacillus halophilus]